MNISLRPVEPDDRDFLRRLYANARSEELASAPWTAERKDAFLKMQFDAQTRHHRGHYPDASFDIILAEAESVGRLYVARWSEEMRIVDISLLPEHRNSGIGTKLLGDLISEADASKKSATIHVERFNPALRLYERLGFRAVFDKGVYLLMERRPG